MYQTFRHIYRTEGVRGFYKGNGVNAIRIAPYNAIQLASFYRYKHWFGASKDNPGRLIAASGCAGMTSVLSCYPLDLVRSVLTIQNEKTKVYSGITDTVRKIHNKSGMRGLYRGLNASMIGIVPYVGVNLAVFDILKHHYQVPKMHPRFDAYNFGMGAVASSLAVTLTYPFEVTRRRIQMGGLLGRKEYDGISDCVKKTVKRQGWKGFYTGFIPCFLRVIPCMSIVMLVNERMRHILDF
jgi:solute carrier family 25 phosphate transporter 23/24/25/41